MKLLVLASDKGGKFAPFIEEQITALQQAGVEVIRYGVTGKGITGYLRELPALRRFIRAERPDIIHAHYGLCGLLANLQRSVPVVTTYHGSDINKPSILRFSKIAIRLSAWNIFVSKRNVALALGKAQAQCTVYSVQCKGEENSEAETTASTPYTLHPTPKHTLLPCGVNIPKPWSDLQTQRVGQLTLNQWVQEKLQSDANNVIFAGAFDNAVKDPELAFAAIELLQTQCNGSDAPVYSVQCKGEETSGAVTSAHTPYTLHHTPYTLHHTPNTSIKLIELKGYNRDQVNALMYNCDAFLMTSKTEGSPQVVKEALACGCPIVSVDVGDVAERTSGVEGCYVVPSREPKDIAEALLKAIAFEGKTNGRDRILEMGLSNEQVAERLIEIYKSIKE